MDTFLDTIKQIVNNLIQWKSWTIFSFDYHLSEKMSNEGSLDQNHVQKIIIDNKYVDLICLSDTQMSEPCFKTIEELRYGIRNQQFLTFPVMDKHDRIVMAIQLESKSYPIKSSSQTGNSKTKKGKIPTKSIGFQMIDEHIIKTFCHYIHMKIERMLAKREASIRERNVVDTLQLISDICTQRTHKGLILKMKNKLPKFMNFQAAGVLIYDKKEDKLLSVAEENTADKEFQESPNLIKFPTTCGITGIVFEQKDADKVNGIPQIEIHSTKDTNILSDIDNLSSWTEVFNFMIGPIYGEDKETPIGIIQLFNKKSNEGITKQDTNKFLAIQGLLGMCVDNTTKMSTTMDVLGHFNGHHALKYVDEKLGTILDSNPKLSKLKTTIKEKNSTIEEGIENNKKTIEATQSVKESVDRQKQHTKKTLDMSKREKEV